MIGLVDGVCKRGNYPDCIERWFGFTLPMKYKDKDLVCAKVEHQQHLLDCDRDKISTHLRLDSSFCAFYHALVVARRDPVIGL